MSISRQSLQAAWLTARRAGAKRTIFRIQRRVRLKLLNPYLGERLYGRVNNTAVPLTPHSPQSEFHKRMVCLADLYQSDHLKEVWNLQDNSLVLLNQRAVQADAPMSWFASPVQDPLWLFQLHGWEWAWPKLADTANREAVFALWTDWLDRIPVGRTIAWEPYPASRRLVVWIAAWQLLGGDERFAAAIAQHANYLSQNLERDLDNNHLVANAKALVWAGLLLPDSRQSANWLQTGLHWLWQCVRLQVRSDGGHIENSTGYHMAVWLDLLSTIYLCQACEVDVPDDVYTAVCRMGDFAWTLRLPNGRLPLLNDSIQDEPLPASSIFALADKVLTATKHHMQLETPRQSKAFPETGIVVFHLEDEQTYLLFDAGDIGPNYCPGHGHADTLGIELWFQGQPLIVDPGTYQYAAGAWRDYFRSTAVHSTATIDGLNQTEFAGPFRVGRIAHGQLISTSLQSGQLKTSGAHNGYTRLPDPVTHQREVIIRSTTEIMLIDTFSGKQQHQICISFHLAPADIKVHAPTTLEAIFPNNICLEITTNSSASGSYAEESGWLSSTWYRKESSSIVKFQSQTALPAQFETTLKIRVKESR